MPTRYSVWRAHPLLILAALLCLSAAPLRGAPAIQVTVTLLEVTGRMVIAPPGQRAPAGATIVYGFQVRNATTITQSFRLSIQGPPAWKIVLAHGHSGKAGPLAPGETTIVPVEVTIPKKASIGSVGVVTMTAVTTAKPQFEDYDSVTTTVVPKGASAALVSASRSSALAASSGPRASPAARPYSFLWPELGSQWSWPWPPLLSWEPGVSGGESPSVEGFATAQPAS